MADSRWRLTIIRQFFLKNDIHRFMMSLIIRICNKILHFLDQNGEFKIAAYDFSSIYVENLYTRVFGVVDFESAADSETFSKRLNEGDG